MYAKNIGYYCKSINCCFVHHLWYSEDFFLSAIRFYHSPKHLGLPSICHLSRHRCCSVGNSLRDYVSNEFARETCYPNTNSFKRHVYCGNYRKCHS